jgi:DNA-binding CsgD family transcriptional regulator
MVPASITNRQRECLRWIAAGKTRKDIAAILSISYETVREHLENALHRLDCATTAQAAVKAYRLGLIDVPGGNFG